MAQFNYSNLSKSSGVYVIFNNNNWRLYVGSTKEFKNRWTQGHYKSLAKNRHQNKFLQADFNKCKEQLGHDDFLEFHVLEHMPNSTRKERLAVEEKWLKMHFDNGKQCYNLCDRALSREGFSAKDPQKTKELISKASKARWKDKQKKEQNDETIAILLAARRTNKQLIAKKIGQANTGKIRTNDMRMIQSQRMKNVPRGPRPEEYKKKMRLLRSLQSGIRLKAIKETDEQFFLSASEAARFFGVSVQTVVNWVKANKPTKSGWEWTYA